MAKVGIMLVQPTEPYAAAKVLVLDGIPTSDRPGAVGFFLFSVMREWFAQFHKFPVVKLKLGMVEAADIVGLDTRTTLLMEDWFGRLYELILAVERNDPGLLEKSQPDPDGP